jgi:hypothetical protein
MVWSHSFLGLMFPKRRGPAGPGRSRNRPPAAAADLARVAAGAAGHVLPAVEVHVRLQVRLPGILDGRLEGHHQHPLGAQLPGELVGGEGLAEAHLGVPEEARHGVHVLLPDGVEVGVGLVHRLGLLGAHGEGLVVRAAEALAAAQLGQHGLHVGRRRSASTPARPSRSPSWPAPRAPRGR